MEMKLVGLFLGREENIKEQRVLVGKTEDHLGRPRRRWEETFKWIVKKEDDRACTGLIWRWRGTSENGGGLLFQ
jgi:hypothetical protein